MKLTVLLASAAIGVATTAFGATAATAEAPRSPSTEIQSTGPVAAEADAGVRVNGVVVAGVIALAAATGALGVADHRRKRT